VGEDLVGGSSLCVLLDSFVCIGENVEFSFSILNNDENTQFIRLEYAIYYLRKNGQLSKKVFKLSERTLNPSEIIKIRRRQSFKIITTCNR
jgi:hypothetical protein